MKNLEAENKKLLDKYDTKTLYTKRLVLKKGTSNDSIKVYEYVMLKCRGILGEETIEKIKEPIDFIGEDSKKYYEDIAKEKMFDWYIFLNQDFYAFWEDIKHEVHIERYKVLILL